MVFQDIVVRHKIEKSLLVPVIILSKVFYIIKGQGLVIVQDLQDPEKVLPYVLWTDGNTWIQEVPCVL